MPWGVPKPLAIDDVDLFGHSLSLSGDRLVIGADGEDSSAVGVGGDDTSGSAGDAGAADLFTRSGSTWSQSGFLKASNTGATDHLGLSVAVSGDLIASGAIYEDSNATGLDGDATNNGSFDSGAVYLFR